jgi:hypothetical protein
VTSALSVDAGGGNPPDIHRFSYFLRTAPSRDSRGQSFGRRAREGGGGERDAPVPDRWREPEGGEPGILGETMNVSEAAATNLLLGVVLGMSGVGAVPVSDEDAERAAQFLGNRAGRASDGGLDSEAVAARWARRFHSGIPVCERCREVRDAAARCDGCGDALCEGCWADGDDLVCGVCRQRRRPPFEDVVVTSGVL